MEFLELAVNVNGQETWKLYGPDLGGRYGGMANLEAIAPPPDLFCPVAPDARGNLHGVYDQRHLSLMWFPSRVTGYGAVPGYRPPPLGFGADISASSAWRCCWSDITGYYCRGRRYYDPIAGRWLSADPLGHGASLSLYDYVGGDPINLDDQDGRLGKGAGETSSSALQGFGGLLRNSYFSMSYGFSALLYGTEQANQWYGQNWQGLKNSVTGAAQTVYDAAAVASFALLSPIAPEQTARAYGPSIDRLYNLDVAFTGGAGNSGWYRTGATIVNATFLGMGTELGQVGRLGETGDIIPTAQRLTAPAAGGEGTVQIFRAVGQNETSSILNGGTYGSGPNQFGKYFALTQEGAQNFANASINAGRQMSITSTTISQSVFNQGFLFNDVGGAGASIHFQEGFLPTLYNSMTPIQFH